MSTRHPAWRHSGSVCATTRQEGAVAWHLISPEKNDGNDGAETVERAVASPEQVKCYSNSLGFRLLKASATLSQKDRGEECVSKSITKPAYIMHDLRFPHVFPTESTHETFDTDSLDSGGTEGGAQNERPLSRSLRSW